MDDCQQKLWQLEGVEGLLPPSMKVIHSQAGALGVVDDCQSRQQELWQLPEGPVVVQHSFSASGMCSTRVRAFWPPRSPCYFLLPKSSPAPCVSLRVRCAFTAPTQQPAELSSSWRRTRRRAQEQGGRRCLDASRIKAGTPWTRLASPSPGPSDGDSPRAPPSLRTSSIGKPCSPHRHCTSSRCLSWAAQRKP